MWSNQYHDRLAAWVDLRHRCRNADLGQAMIEINRWWFGSPWRPYYLHWDDQTTWPDPWQLLADNHYCDLARALGMLYTIDLMDRSDITTCELVETDRGNLVLVDEGKYILNWAANELLNIQSQSITIKRRTQQPIKRAYK
jgi:hypothetical protein